MRRTLAALFASLFVCATAGAQPPLTPGDVVLLAGNQDSAAAETLRHALIDSNPDVRRAAGRVISVGHPELFDALRDALDSEQDATVVSEYVRDVLALGGAKALPIVDPLVERHGLTAVAPMADWLARVQPDEFAKRLPAWGKLPRASTGLQQIVELAIARHPEQRDAILHTWQPLVSEEAWKRLSKPAAPSSMYTLTELPAGLLSSTLAAANCKPAPDAWGAASMSFGADGRPLKISVDPATLSDKCRKALVALSRISLDPPSSGGRPQVLIVPMIPAFVACTVTHNAAVEPKMVGPSEGVASPILKKEVKPAYTKRAYDEKVQGVTEMEAIVSSAGCVQSAVLTRSIATDLDFQAIKAALQWQFQPGTFQGRPVAVFVNIELTFTLK